MNITTIHEEYMLVTPYWAKCRTCFDGQEAVQSAGTLYLPQLGDQTDPDYEAYKLRAVFFNAFAKTVSSHTGLAIRTPISVEVPDQFEDSSKNIDRNGSSVQDYMKETLEQVLIVGRGGTLVDYPLVEEGSTRAEVKDARPYWTFYRAEDILDWEHIDGKLTYVMVREHLTRKDEFYSSTKKLTRFRQLSIKDGIYQQEIYIEGDDKKMLQIGEPIIPKINNKHFEEIPFVFHQGDFSTHVNKPPLLDLANTNLAHYRVSADYYHGLHLVALPTPYITGVDPEDPNNPSSIGPQKLWIIEANDAKVGLLEFTGAGLDAVKVALGDLKLDMAMLGARMLMNEQTEKTATAAKIKSISETSDLAAIVSALNTQFTRLLKITVEWFGAPSDDVSATISRAFLPPDLDAPMLVALVKSWQEGAYDYPTLVTNLQTGEIIDPNRKAEEIESAVEQEMNDRFAKESVGLADKNPALVQPPVLKEVK